MLNLRSFGAVGNGVANDTTATVDWFNCMMALKRRGYGPQGVYMIDTIQIDNIDANLSIECHPDCVFKGRIGYEEFAGNGVTKVFTVTAFNTYNDSQGCSAQLISSAGVITPLTKVSDTPDSLNEFRQVNNVFTLFTAPPTGTKLQVVSSALLMRLSATEVPMPGPADRGNYPWFEWRGGKIDCSLRGFIFAAASGTGMRLLRFRGSIYGVNFYGGKDYMTVRATGHGGDSGLTVSSATFFEVSGCYARGWGDAFIYSNGQYESNAETTDRGVNVHVHDNHINRCSLGIRHSRGYKGVIVANNTIDQCEYGIFASIVPAVGRQTSPRGLIMSLRETLLRVRR